jgi:RimJ/RimL family protein N-acetyltransferase
MTLPADLLALRDQLPVKPAPVTLTGDKVVLRPLSDADFEGLHAVSNGQPFSHAGKQVAAYDPEAQVWRWMKRGPFPDVAALRAYLVADAELPDMRVLTVCDRTTATPLGIFCLMTNRPADLKIELGGIWYGPIAQGTGASREATMLALGHAFGLGYRRVEWKCDAQNERSRRAALSYGFTFEGIQQQHMIIKDKNRDTAWFRMLSTEWRG